MCSLEGSRLVLATWGSVTCAEISTHRCFHFLPGIEPATLGSAVQRHSHRVSHSGRFIMNVSIYQFSTWIVCLAAAHKCSLKDVWRWPCELVIFTASKHSGKSVRQFPQAKTCSRICCLLHCSPHQPIGTCYSLLHFTLRGTIKRLCCPRSVTFFPLCGAKKWWENRSRNAGFTRSH